MKPEQLEIARLKREVAKLKDFEAAAPNREWIADFTYVWTAEGNGHRGTGAAIPIVYSNDRRAILAMEKGAHGERVFADAFLAWKQ
jgi:transposase InsO family protein